MSDNGTQPDHEKKTVFDAKARWAALMAMAEAQLALKKAADLCLMAEGSTLAASSVFLLYEAAHGLTREMGQNFSTMRTSDDPEARNFVDLVIDRLRHPPSSEGAMKEPVT